MTPTKQMLVRQLSALFLLGISIIPAALAGDAKVQGDGSVTWQAGVDGVEIEWKPDGTVRRLHSRYSTPVAIADRRGIHKAQVIAEEKAKANIIRFLNQSSTSTRIVAEVQADVNKATQRRETGKEASLKKVDEQTIIESLTEVTTSFAAGTLKGVIVLERGYDEKLNEAWVTVGISDKTIAAARGVKGVLDESPKSPADSQSDLGMQRGEIRRSKQKDW
jgi:hypothetical protein